MNNVECKSCRRFYADGFKKCPYCCSHEILSFDWSTNSWELTVVCDKCGRNFWSKNFIIKNYKAIKKDALSDMRRQIKMQRLEG